MEGQKDETTGDVIHMGWAEAVGVQVVTPRVKTALRLYVSGAVPSMKEASEAAGLHPYYLRQISKRSPLVKAYIRKLENDIDAGTVQMSATMQEMGRRAVARIASIMESDEVKDDIRLKAAIDLADRSPETSKTNKLSIESTLTIREGDAQRILAALAEGAQVAAEYDHQVANGDFVKVDDAADLAPAPLLLGGKEV